MFQKTYNKQIIKKAEIKHLNICSEILKNTKLGCLYFADSNGHYIGDELLLEGFQKDDIYVSFDIDNPLVVVGFSWIQSRGIFNWFPFLHLVAVDKDQRAQGYGKGHLLHFEDLCRDEYESDKAFLMVGSYNQNAIQLYEGLGYESVGGIPNLFVQGVEEILFFKDL